MSNHISELHVASCGVNYPNLRIAGNSSYCNVGALTWESRRTELGNCKLSYEGCYIDARDALAEATTLCAEMKPIPRGSEDLADEAIVSGFTDLQDTINGGGWKGASARPWVSQEKGPSFAPMNANGEETWWTKWKGLVAMVIGAGAGGLCGFMWYSAGGVYIQGPFGFKLAMGYVNFAAAGAAGMTGVACGIATGAAIYLIPWDKVFNYIMRKLWSIWDKICEVVSWVWEKIKEWRKALLSMITG